MADDAFGMVSKGVFVVVMIIIIMYLVMPDMYYKHVNTYMPKDPNSVVRTVRSKDKKFNELLENVHTELRKSAVQLKGVMCKNKKGVFMQIDMFIDSMSEADAKRLCSETEWKNAKKQMHSQKEMQSFNLLPQGLVNSLFDLLSYTTLKYFCKKGMLQKGVLKTYLKDMVNDLCSDASPMIGYLTYNGQYLINTPLSYIKM